MSFLLCRQYRRALARHCEASFRENGRSNLENPLYDNTNTLNPHRGQGSAISYAYVLRSSFSLERKVSEKFKAKTIGPPHGQPKRLTFSSGSDFSEVKRKRPSVKVKRLVRPLGNRCPAFWPWPARPTQ